MASYLFVRATDHLVIGVRWSGFSRTGLDAAGVPVLTASAQARLVVLLPPQHVGEEASPKGSTAPLQLPAGTSGGTVPAWRGVLSGGSRVAFKVEAGTRIALSAEGVLAAIANNPLLTSTGVPGAEETAIELPWRLLITPGGRSGAVVCRHFATPVVSTEVSGMWRTRLTDATIPIDLAQLDAGLTLRVADENLAATLDPEFGPANSLPLIRGDRVRVFTETNHTRAARVERLELSALGGTLDAIGVWPNFEWEQHTVLGRDMKVRTLAKGALYPFGHRAEFLQVSQRVFDPDTGAMILRVLRVLIIVEPVRHAPPPGPIRRGFPLGDIEITTTTFTDLLTPAYVLTPLPGVGNQPTHFLPKTSTGPVLFPIRAMTSTGDIRFELPLLFVADLRPTFDTLTSLDLALRLASDYGASTVGLPAAVLDLGGSAERDHGAAGDLHEVHSITVTGATGIDLRDGFRARLSELEVSLPALRVLRGDGRLSKVSIAKKYVDNGAEDVILTMQPGQGRPIDFSAAADKSGGLVAPEYDTNAISRTLGPVSLQALPDPVTKLIDPAALFRSDKATLLGIPLKSLLTQLKQPPQITSIPIPGSAPEVHMRWRDVAVKSVGPLVANPSTRLDLEITIAANHTTTECTLKNFAFELPPGPKRILRLSFKELKFSQHGGSAPSVDVDGVKAEFLGELKLLEKLQDAVKLGAAGKLIEVSPSGLKVRYSLPIPQIATGVFVMRNLALSVGIDIPFNGQPVSVALGFASRANPFQLSVLMFGGGGYVEIQLDRDGLKLFEAALEFGAIVAVDFVIASGEVHALGGVRFTLDRGGAVTLTGYLRIGGCIEVLGLIAVSVELCLSMTYNSDRNALVGRATLVIEIDLTLWSDSVELDSGEWVLAGGGGDRDHPLADAAADDALARWREYRAAFADEELKSLDATRTAILAAADEPSTTDQFRVVFHRPISFTAGRVVWSPDDRWVVVGYGQPSSLATSQFGLTCLDAESGASRWQVNEYICRHIAVSPDAQRIAISTSAGGVQRLRMLDAATGSEIWNIPGFGTLAFSPDGTLLGLTGTLDPSGAGRSTTFVLDARTGMVLHNRSQCLTTPAFSADSQLVCTGSPGLAHSRSGVPVWEVNEHDGFASACAFTPGDDGVVVASGRFGTIIVYEPELTAGTIVERSHVAAPSLSAASPLLVDSIRFSRDRGMVALIGFFRLGLITVADGGVVFLHQIPRLPHDIYLSFHPDGSQLAVNYTKPGQSSVGLAVLDTKTGEPVWSDPEPTIIDLAFSNDGSRVLAGGAEFVRVYEAGRPVRARRDCGGPVLKVAASAAEADIIAAVATGERPKLTVFRAATGEPLLERVHSGTISSVAISPDGRSVATANADGNCLHFDTQTGTRWRARHRGPVNAVAFSDDSRRLATAGKDRTARLFDRQLPAGADPENHQPQWAQQHPNAVTQIAIGPTAAWVATAALDDKIRILAATTGAELHAFEHDGRIHDLSVGGTGILASASEDGSASVIDAATGRRRFRIEHPAPIAFAVLSGDGALLATASSDGEVRIWRIDANEALLVRHFAAAAPVTALAFDPAGPRLVIATEHPVVRVLDPLSGNETDRLFHPEPVRHLMFGVDGGLLATGCDDNFARVYELRHR